MVLDKTVEVVINDKTYEFGYNIRSLRKMDKKTSKPIIALFQGFSNGDVPSIDDLCILFQYGFMLNSDITEDSAEEMLDLYLDEHTLGDLIQLTAEALRKSLGNKKN